MNSVKLEETLKNDSFIDFEDCLQMECAKDFGAKFIVTRNIKDYVSSSIKPIEPTEFLQQINI
jgi:predicted nucleic acid-binding protein